MNMLIFLGIFSVISFIVITLSQTKQTNAIVTCDKCDSPIEDESLIGEFSLNGHDLDIYQCYICNTKMYAKRLHGDEYYELVDSEDTIVRSHRNLFPKFYKK